MTIEWPEYQLGQAGRIVTGKTPKGGVAEFEGEDVPFITPPDFSGKKFISKPARFISEAGAQSVKGSLIPERSVLVTCIGSDMGKAAIAASRCVTNQQINTLIVDESKFCSEFIYYNLSLRKAEIQSLAGGSAQPILNKSAFSLLTFKAPSLGEQRLISSILRPIDDRITFLRETNLTLEAIAQAMFKSWFVDFDPVRVKQEGRQPDGIDQATAELFSDSFEQSEFGEIPAGWTLEALDKNINFLNGLALQKFPPTGINDLPVIKIAQLRKGDAIGADLAASSLKPEYVVKDGDVLFSWSGSLEVEIWCGGEGALNQHLFKVTSLVYPRWFIYLWTRKHLNNFREIAASKATTMGHIQRSHLSAA
jgi:type I restriction enzyme S subunit